MSYFDDGVLRLVLDNEPPRSWDTSLPVLWQLLVVNLGLGGIGGALG